MHAKTSCRNPGDGSTSIYSCAKSIKPLKRTHIDKPHMAKSNRTPNDQKSDAYNSNSAEHKANADNRSVQMGKKSK